jgi:hypothetical protein
VELQPSHLEPTPRSQPAAPPQAGVDRPTGAATAGKRPGSAKLLNAVLAIAVALAIGGVAFAAGRLTAPAPTNPFGNGGPGQFFGNGGNGGNGGNNGQGGPRGFLTGGAITLEGTVESVTDTTLTLKTASGQTIQVALDGSTTYHAQSDASASDVTTGSSVLVRVSGFRGRPGASADPGGANQAASDITVVP